MSDTQRYSEGEVWRVASVPGKGLGVEATADIPQGEAWQLAAAAVTRSCAGALILVDTPLFTVPDSAHTEDPATLDAELARRVAALEPAARDYFYSLADCKGEVKTARGVYFTNCFTIGTSPRSPTALLPTLARINHSCRPNTEFHWDAAAGAEQLRAVRDIRRGEELTDCYLDLTLAGRVTREQRRRLLRGGYGFW